jgi:hypothetical protein
MAAVQGAGDVGGRQRDGEGADGIRGLLGGFGLEEALLFPPLVPCRLDSAGVVGGEVRVVEGEDGLLLAERSLVGEGREGRCRLSLGLGRLGLFGLLGLLLVLLGGELCGLLGGPGGLDLVFGL